MKSIRLVLQNKEQPYIATGMDLYRLVMPWSEVAESADQVKGMSLDEFDLNKCEADVYVMNRPRSFRAEKVKQAGKMLIVDVDDHVDLPKWHNLNPDTLKKRVEYARVPENKVPHEEAVYWSRLYEHEKNQKQNTIDSCKIADYVTCSTERLKSVLMGYDINPTKIVVVKNTIHPEVYMFDQPKLRSNKVRFGWVGGNHHRRDVALMYDGIRRIHENKELIGKYQFLMSFNKSPDYIEQEKIFTNGYRACSPEYVKHLIKYTRVGSHIGNDEAYKRLWNMSPTEYGTMYENIDVALIPLHEGQFNACKSELKLIEAAHTGCAAIVSNVMPYAPYLKDGYNCLTCDGTKGWYSGIKALINNPERIATLANNLRKTIAENFDYKVESDKLKNLIK